MQHGPVHTILRRCAIVACLAGLMSGDTAEAQVTWVLDGTTNIGGHATTVVGSPTVVATPFGSGLRFDGNDGLIVNTNPLAGATAFTMEMLLRPDVNESVTLDEPRILHIQSTTPPPVNDHRALLEGRIQGNQWYVDGFLRAPAAGNPSTIASLALINPAQLHAANRWYSFALVYDGAELRVYLNNTLELSGPIAITSLATGQTSIGMRHSRERFFSGDIAKVRFTPAALTADALLSSRLPGDFNGDYYSPAGGIDGRDLMTWQEQYGGAGPFLPTGLNADGDNDGDVDGTDWLIWQRNLGPSSAVVSAAEPAGLAPIVTALAGGLLQAQRNKKRRQVGPGGA